MQASGPATSSTQKLTTITLGVPGIPPVFLGVMPYTALQQGYYKKYGLDVQIKGFTSGTDAVRPSRWMRERLGAQGSGLVGRRGWQRQRCSRADRCRGMGAG